MRCPRRSVSLRGKAIQDEASTPDACWRCSTARRHSAPRPLGSRPVRRAIPPSLQLIQRDRQIANALAGRVIDGIGDRRRDPDNTDLAEAFCAERIDERVRLVDEDYLDVANVGI